MKVKEDYRRELDDLMERFAASVGSDKEHIVQDIMDNELYFDQNGQLCMRKE